MSDAELIELTLEDGDAGQRIDKVLAAKIDGFSRSRLQALITEGAITLDGVSMWDASRKVKSGQVVVIDLPPLFDADPAPENIPLDIVFEDDDLIIINKPVGLVVHPAAGHAGGTLVNALLYHCGDTLSGVGGVKRPGIVHRLDRETSGLMVAAKHDRAHAGLAAQLKDKTLGRVYWGISVGVPVPPLGLIDHHIGRHNTNRLKMAVSVRGGREAVTHYTVLERYRDYFALVKFQLETGRTHQIRVHAEANKFPLLGDPLYGAQPTFLSAALNKAGYDEGAQAVIKGLARQALHAKELGFIHPVTGEDMHFESDLPGDMQAVQSALAGL